MKRSEWSDNELKELLRQMPIIKDHRDPRDIYQNISLKKKKTRLWLLPGLAAATALILFFILVPKLMGGTDFSYQKAKEKSSLAGKTAAKGDTSAMKKEIANSNEMETPKSKQAGLLKSENVLTAIYEDQISNSTVFTYWIPDSQAQILIPISIIVNENQAQSGLLPKYIDLMANLQEVEWGLTDCYPLNASIDFNQNGNTVMVDVPSNHQYGQGSTTETNFMNILMKDFAANSNIRKIMFTTNGQPGIELGNLGRVEEMDVVPEEKHAYFFYYTEGSKIPFLTPSSKLYNNINAALEAMKADQSMELKSSLHSLPPINNVSISDKIMYVSFNLNSRLEENQQSLWSFEALLLTAKEFGADKVVIKNPTLSKFGTFDLTKEIKVPIAPNYRKIP